MNLDYTMDKKAWNHVPTVLWNEASQFLTHETSVHQLSVPRRVEKASDLAAGLLQTNMKRHKHGVLASNLMFLKLSLFCVLFITISRLNLYYLY